MPEELELPKLKPLDEERNNLPPELTEEPKKIDDPLKDIKKVINRLYAIVWILLGALALGLLVILLIRIWN
ncbi:MAG: hypothetical protein KAJ49_04580 [Arcobacteraceae bacterium]|nr:hypothetical protein [Arcobacteraceae bacterium]